MVTGCNDISTRPPPMTDRLIEPPIPFAAGAGPPRSCHFELSFNKFLIGKISAARLDAMNKKADEGG